MVDFPITFYIREVFGRLSPGAQRLGGGLTSGNETMDERRLTMLTDVLTVDDVLAATRAPTGRVPSARATHPRQE